MLKTYLCCSYFKATLLVSSVAVWPGVQPLVEAAVHHRDFPLGDFLRSLRVRPAVWPVRKQHTHLLLHQNKARHADLVRTAQIQRCFSEYLKHHLGFWHQLLLALMQTFVNLQVAAVSEWFLCGALKDNFSSSYPCRFGRKPVMFVSAALMSLSTFAQAFSTSWPLFCVLYFLTGTGRFSFYLATFVLGKFKLPQ